MSLPRLRKILREDLKDAPSWVDRLIDPINQFMETTYSILNKNISFANNIACQLKELDFTTSPIYDKNVPSTFNPLKFQSTLRTKAFGMQTVKITEVGGNYTPIIEPIHINWYEYNGEINIPFITNLKPNTRYIINLIII